ncbi:hypothetical protein H2203_004465 [Taxawa tesnikishii (nom. ined.)]|nr:hypothetical protein H2203_004465 [Dothideales sp. JES 119]
MKVPWLLLLPISWAKGSRTRGGPGSQQVLAQQDAQLSEPSTPTPYDHVDFPHHDQAPEVPARPSRRVNPLNLALNALEDMQTHFFELWVGTWPTSIDWTGAVLNTYVSTLMRSLSKATAFGNRDLAIGGSINCEDDTDKVFKDRFTHALAYCSGESDFGKADPEYEFNKYFTHIIAYYFGENAFAIRNEAYDDMLWVVLGWLETVRFVVDHALDNAPPLSPSWHGSQWVGTFAHRARVFYDIASRGWDTKLCGGGMTWNPNLAPYKNAITNQLFITSSINMYFYFPGDNNSFPFIAHNSGSEYSSEHFPHDSKYLKAAADAYSWLKDSNMTNHLGLYVDGFHIRGWNRNGSTGTGKCDVRNEVVYTYNQGVILSGLRKLWEATGDTMYLEDGYDLIHNVIFATGWNLDKSDVFSNPPSDQWSGLGRNGIMEELCDHTGSCDQNGQTFKGIYFLHLAGFCEPLPSKRLIPGKSNAASRELAHRHRSECMSYRPWVDRNAKAALSTRDEERRFGMWWGQKFNPADADIVLPENATDYRNNATLLEAPSGRVWQLCQLILKRKSHVMVQISWALKAEAISTIEGGVVLSRPRVAVCLF